MSYESDIKFVQWKKEIEKRCLEHLQKHPESNPPKPAEKPAPKQEKAFVTEVKVTESFYAPGCWTVWQDGVAIETFTGSLAQRDALRLATRLSNGEKF
jgi:hypothetical protein